MNTFAYELAAVGNMGTTENGATKHLSTNSAIYDMFALAGAFRGRSDDDCILKFKNAFEENESLAMKCLFYLRDCRGGLGERRFFRVCFHWLCNNYPEAAKRNLIHVAEFGRWDDLIYSCLDTPLETEMLSLISNQLLAVDAFAEAPSILAKWVPSENASSAATKKAAKRIREYLHLSHREYRHMLSTLRKRIKVTERLMSLNEWDKIDFSKLPSKAGLNYKDAFARREETAERYKEFISSKDTKINVGTLYPYEIAEKADEAERLDLNDPKRIAVNKYWDNQVDYFDGQPCSMICVCDTSGSMWGRPMDVSNSLGIYCAERMKGPFGGSYISFSSKPQIIKVEGVDFVDKYSRIKRTNLCENTDLEAVFDLLLSIADRPDVKEEDIPQKIVVISDMEIDAATSPDFWGGEDGWTKYSVSTEMEKVRQKWLRNGHKMPNLIYWNVDARSDTILDSGDNVTFVSGCSPTLFKSILSGKSGIDLCLEVLNSARYACIQ